MEDSPVKTLISRGQCPASIRHCACFSQVQKCNTELPSKPPVPERGIQDFSLDTSFHVGYLEREYSQPPLKQLHTPRTTRKTASTKLPQTEYILEFAKEKQQGRHQCRPMSRLIALLLSVPEERLLLQSRRGSSTGQIYVCNALCL